MLCEVEHSRCDPVSTKCFSVSGRMYCQCKAGFTKLDYYLDRCDGNMYNLKNVTILIRFSLYAHGADRTCLI